MCSFCVKEKKENKKISFCIFIELYHFEKYLGSYIFVLKIFSNFLKNTFQFLMYYIMKDRKIYSSLKVSLLVYDSTGNLAKMIYFGLRNHITSHFCRK